MRKVFIMFSNIFFRSFVGRLAFSSGLTTWLRQNRPWHGAVILYGHRIIEREEGFFGGIPAQLFERQLAYLSENYNLIRFSELVEYIQKGNPIPPNSITLTFDDGFRDNYSSAFPLLVKYSVPATIFLCADCIQRGEMPWPQRLGYILEHTEQKEICIQIPDPCIFSLQTQTDRRLSLNAIKTLRSRLSLKELEELISSLIEQTGIQPPKDRMLTWDQIREMQQGGIEFGAHTLTHPLMEYLSEKEAWKELADSKQLIEHELGRPIQYFAFPAGSYNDRLIEMVRQVGYLSIFKKGKKNPINTHHTDLFDLGRLGLANEPVGVLATELAGIFRFFRRIKNVL